MAPSVNPGTYSAVTTFTDIYSKYEDAFDRVPAQVRSVEWVADQLSPGSKVLDVGCGTGKPGCEILVNAGMDVTGIDITPKMIEIAKSKAPKARYAIADSRQWEPADGDASLDAVVSYFAFIAGVTQDDIRAFFRRAIRWLRPGGIFVFGTVPVEGENLPIQWLGRDVIVSSLSAADSVEAIKSAGFTIEKQEIEAYKSKAAEYGICKPEEVWEEEHLIVYCRKPA